ncbi:MAG TPA: hypothetical protein VD997_09315 [Phycisphaerales bacterium]|nr:hypothetical protein [Phycisphaerales bacterium]
MSTRMCVAGLLAMAGFAAGVSAQELILAEYQYEAARFVRMGLDGSNPQTAFLLPAADWLPMGVSYNAANNTLVWMDSGGGSEVHQAGLDGSGHTVLSGVGGFARGTSRDAAGRVFYSTNNELQRMNADGSNIVTMYAAPATEVVLSPRVDATNGFVYFCVEGQIKRVPVDGGAAQTVVTGVSQARAIGLHHAAGYIYWIDGDTITDHVARARLDNTGFEIVFDCSYNDTSGSSGLTDLLLAPALGKMFISDELAGTVRSLNLDGTGVQTIYTSPTGLAPIAMTLTTGDVTPALQDCNGNGVGDGADIAGGAADCNNNGVVDTCEASACPTRNFLLNHGASLSSGQGRALGRPSQWQVFQPFDVTATWRIGEIGIDGHTSNYVVENEVLVAVFPENPVTSRPDETSAPLATTSLTLRFSPWFESWAYAPLNVTLEPGRYWVRLVAEDPINFAASIHHGASGLQSRSRGTSGNFTSLQSPIAMRLVQTNAPVCGTADYNGDGDIGTDQDIEAFFACLGGSCCPTCFEGGSDFNGDGDFGTDQDIESFFRVLGGGPC